MKPIPIVMPVKDRLALTKQTIETLYKNTTLPFKLIVVSDNSEKKVNEYLAETSVKHENMRAVMMPSSMGPAACKNAGAATLEDFDYIYFTDNDIYFLPNWLETLLKILNEFPEVGIAGGRTHAYHGHTDETDKGGLRIRYSQQQSGYSMLFRKKTWFQCAPFSHHAMPKGIGKEDVAMCILAAVRFNWKIAHPVEPAIVHCGLKNTFGDNMVGLDDEQKQKFPPGAVVN